MPKRAGSGSVMAEDFESIVAWEGATGPRLPGRRQTNRFAQGLSRRRHYGFMKSKLGREIRLLKIYVLLSSAAWVVLTLAAFAPRKPHFQEIDVERINVVEKNGQIKLVLSNKERFPDPGNVVTGRHSKRVGLPTPGILYYNDAGDECGGLIFTSKQEPDGKYSAGSLLTFDKYHGDQVMGLQAEEGGGKRIVGLNVWDQPELSGEERKARFAAAQKMAPGPERDVLLQQAVANQRVFIGRGKGKAATLVLSDGNGRPRIRMAVAQDGASKLEFLDAAGKVIETLPRP